MTDVIKTAEELNAWLESKFEVCDGPPRSFFRLPIKVVIDGQPIRVDRNIAYVTIRLRGNEEQCCAEAAERITDCVPMIDFEGDVAVIFRRRRFEYNAEECVLYGRLAFCDLEQQQNLLKSAVI